jgi:hypothetical protein
MSRLRLNQITTPANPAATKLDMFYSSTLVPVAPALIDENGNICRIGGFTTKDYRIVKETTILNGTTSYTPTSGVSALFVQILGGGGAGGGAAAGTAATNFGSGGGGGGGEYAFKWITTLVSGAHGSIAVGAGGTAGTTGANPGNTGGTTTFTDNTNATVFTAIGGTGGASAAASAVLGIRSFGGAGGTGGTGSDRASQGEDGKPSVVYAPTVAATGGASGRGGCAGGGLGYGGVEVQTSGPGNAGRIYGGGGSGGIDSASTTRQGGVGANGIIIVMEYA